MFNFIIVEFEPGKPFDDIRSANAWRAAGAEFVATLLFVFVGCLSVVVTGFLEFGLSLSPARVLVIALAHGLAIAILVGAIGSISGGHVNPMVTLAFVITGRLSIIRGIMYFLSQMIGGIFGAGLVKGVALGTEYGYLGAHTVNNNIGTGQGLVVEILITFILIFTIFGAAVDVQGPGIIAPMLIGFAITVAHLIAVPLTGASMNPARTFGPAVWTGVWNNQWVYWLGPFIGSVLAVLIYTNVLLRGLRALDHTEAELDAMQSGRVLDTKNNAAGQPAAGAPGVAPGVSAV